MSRALRHLACLLLAPAAALAGPDAAPSGQLAPPAGETYWSANDPFVITVAGLRAPGERLRLELDAVDVSALIEVAPDGHEVQFHPVVPLKPGVHHLRLVEETSAGEVFELASWELEARESAPWQSHELQYALAVSSATQLAHSDSVPRDRHIRTNGSLRVDASGNTGLGKLALRANVSGDSNSIRTGRDVGLMLGSFQASASDEDSILMAGDHSPQAPGASATPDMVFDGASRRGVSYSEQIPSLHSSFSAYSFGADPVKGFRNGFAFSNPDNRITGGRLQMAPWTSGSDGLSMGFGFVHGQGTRGGSTIGTADGGVILRSQGVTGDAGNAVLDAKFLGGSLGLHSEYARTRRSIGFGIGSVSDNAQLYALNYQTPEGFVIGADTLTWTGTLSHQRIGTLFRSVADPGGAVDVLGDKASVAFQYGTIALDLSGARSHDSVDNLPFAKTHIDNYVANFSWSPALQPETMPAWLNQPSLTLSFGEDRRRLGDQPAGAPANPFDTSNRIGSVGLAFVHPYGAWALSYNYSSAKDRTGLSCPDAAGNAPPYCEARGATAGLDTNFSLGESATLSGQLQWNLQSDRARSVDTRAASGSLSLQYVVMKDRWNVSLNLSSNHSAVSDDSIDMQGETASLDSTWRYGVLGFSLSGSYQHERDRSPAEVYVENEFDAPMTVFQVMKQERWQVLGRFTLALPPKKGSAR